LPGPIPTTIGVLFTLAVVIVITIPRRYFFTAQPLRITPVLIIIILVDYLILIQLSNSLEVAWLVLPAAWWLNLCSEIITTLPRETLAVALNLPQGGYLQNGANDLIPKGTGVVPPPTVHLAAGLIIHLPHTWREGCPPLPIRQTAAPAVRPHQLE
jgi:hypothetical protein